MTSRKLADDQLASFDTEYVTPFLWESVERRIHEDFPSGRLRFVDIGGGNGIFADRVLEAFPSASGVVLEPSRLLIDRNATHTRKQVVEGGIDDASKLLRGERFDVVFLNWVLHHLVTDSWAGTRAAQERGLHVATSLLAPAGRISVMENFYDGAIVDRLPGRLIFAATASRSLVPLTRRFGANTAGVGVAFRSERGWLSMLAANGLEPSTPVDDAVWSTRLSRRVVFQIRTVRAGHVWCRAAERSTAPGISDAL